MNNKIGPYQVVELPPARRDVLSFIDLSSWERHMFGLLEVDVTVARQWIAAYKARTGERMSFTGYLAFCLAQAVDEDKAVQAYPKGRKQLVMFDDVDVGLMIERQMGETRAPVGYVVRRANHKTFMEIHQEIRAVQTGGGLANEGAPRWVGLLELMPGPVQKLCSALFRMAIHRDPAGLWVPMVGTVGISSVGMFGQGGGWPLAAPAAHTLCLFVGGIARKPAVVGDRIEPRELLSLTVAFNHEAVDGAPAARFVSRLVELIETGYGLDVDGTTRAVGTEPEALQAAPAVA